MSWDLFENSGLAQDKCECLNCFPWFHRFKWACVDAESIDDVIRLLEEQVQFFNPLNMGSSIATSWLNGGSFGTIPFNPLNMGSSIATRCERGCKQR